MNKIKRMIIKFLIKQELKTYPDHVGKIRLPSENSLSHEVRCWNLFDGLYIATDIEYMKKLQVENINYKIEKEKVKLKKLENKIN